MDYHRHKYLYFGKQIQQSGHSLSFSSWFVPHFISCLVCSGVPAMLKYDYNIILLYIRLILKPAVCCPSQFKKKKSDKSERSLLERDIWIYWQKPGSTITHRLFQRCPAHRNVCPAQISAWKWRKFAAWKFLKLSYEKKNCTAIHKTLLFYWHHEIIKCLLSPFAYSFADFFFFYRPYPNLHDY